MKAKWDLIKLGIFNCLLLTTYTSFSYIITYIYEQKDTQFKQMGPVLLFSSFFAFLCANSIAPNIKIKLKTQLLIGSLCYTVNYGLQTFDIQQTTLGITLSIFGAALGGFGAAIFWVSYGAYTKSLCALNNQHQIQGQYFGLIGLVTYSSSILGPAITTFALGFFSSQIYFIVLTILGITSFLFCLFFIKDIEYVNQIEQKEGILSNVAKNCLYYRKMKPILAVLALDGLCLGFISTSVSKILPNNPDNSVTIGLFLIVLGIGAVIGSFISGIISDRLLMKNVGRGAILMILVCCVFNLFCLKYTGIIVGFICSFMWGFAWHYLENWLYLVCSRQYDGALQAYANLKQLHSFTVCLYQIYLIITNGEVSLEYFLLVLILLSLPSFYNLQNLGNNLKQAHHLEESDSQ